MEKEILTTFEAARYCQVHPGTIKNWIMFQNLKAFRTPGGHRRIYRRELERFLRERQMPLARETLSPRHRVLVIGADRELREQIATALHLRMQGYEVATAADGFEGGELLVAFRPGLVIVDCPLPGMNPVDFCHHLKDSPYLDRARVLCLTDHPESLSQALLEHCTDGVLPRLVTMKRLCLEVERIVSYES